MDVRRKTKHEAIESRKESTHNEPTRNAINKTKTKVKDQLGRSNTPTHLHQLALFKKQTNTIVSVIHCKRAFQWHGSVFVRCPRRSLTFSLTDLPHSSPFHCNCSHTSWFPFSHSLTAASLFLTILFCSFLLDAR